MKWPEELKFWHLLVVPWGFALIEIATQWLSVPAQDATHTWAVHFRGTFGMRYV